MPTAHTSSFGEAKFVSQLGILYGAGSRDGAEQVINRLKQTGFNYEITPSRAGMYFTLANTRGKIFKPLLIWNSRLEFPSASLASVPFYQVKLHVSNFTIGFDLC